MLEVQEAQRGIQKEASFVSVIFYLFFKVLINVSFTKLGEGTQVLLISFAVLFGSL